MHVNITAVLAATLASYVLGSLWYLALGKRWRTAVGWAEQAPYRPTVAELGIALLGQVILAIALAVVFAHTGVASVSVGLFTGAALWFGFVLPTLATNVVFQRRNLALIWQDGGHWLLILVAQGCVLGILR